MPAIRLLLVDALNLIRRVYAAQPGDDSPDRAVRARTSSGQSLQRALQETAPTHAVAVFEGPQPTWRHRLLPGYKSGHPPMPAALRAELMAFRAAFAALGVASFELAGHEADDVIGTLATKVAGAGGSAVILSTDKSFLQLLSPSIAVRDHFARRDLDRQWVHRRFGVEPERLLDVLALSGDSTASIPGVPGVGPKTATRLIAASGSLEALLVAAAEVTAGHRREGTPAITARLAARLTAHRDDAVLARTLLRLQTDLELGSNLQSLRYPA